MKHLLQCQALPVTIIMMMILQSSFMLFCCTAFAPPSMMHITRDNSYNYNCNNGKNDLKKKHYFKRQNDHQEMALFSSNNSDGDSNFDFQAAKFDFQARVDSAKSGIVGLLAGGIALTPFSALHDIFIGGGSVVNGVAQWEFDTDMGSLEAALFAIVYRYCIREDENPMLNQGVIGAFVIVRVLSKIQVPEYCSAAPLDCGSPLGYFDWNMIQQGILSGVESAALFGAAAVAMDYCFQKGFISKFR